LLTCGVEWERGDRVTVGASRPEQLKRTKEWVDEGGLGERVCSWWMSFGRGLGGWRRWVILISRRKGKGH